MLGRPVAQRPRLPLALAACDGGAMDLDPAVSNPQHYTVVLENDRVRVLLYRDRPGEETTPHRHPDSVMYTLSSFERRLHAGGEERDVAMDAGTVAWLPAQEHHGLNTGDTETHVLFVELKEPAGGAAVGASEPTGLGPQLG
jgi:quercetin dioxygenase-like cupin family protein